MLFADNTLGKYKILSTLGSGGFGTVYLAEDTWINKKVARPLLIVVGRAPVYEPTLDFQGLAARTVASRAM